jgi:hypothetical protein
LVRELTDDVRDAIMAHVFAGRKIDAIKVHRQATGQGLVESKRFIEALEARLREESPGRFEATVPAGCGAGVIAVMLLTAILAGVAGLALLFW